MAAFTGCILPPHCQLVLPSPEQGLRQGWGLTGGAGQTSGRLKAGAGFSRIVAPRDLAGLGPGLPGQPGGPMSRIVGWLGWE